MTGRTSDGTKATRQRFKRIFERIHPAGVTPQYRHRTGAARHGPTQAQGENRQVDRKPCEGD